MYQIILGLIPIAQNAIRFENVPFSMSVIPVDGVVVVVESLRARVPAADVRLEAVLVLGQVGALRALEADACVDVEVLDVAQDAALGRQHLVARVAQEPAAFSLRHVHAYKGVLK